MANHLTPEQRAAIYEQAVEMSERTGKGVEQCMVQLTAVYFGPQQAAPDRLPTKGLATQRRYTAPLRAYSAIRDAQPDDDDEPFLPRSNHATGITIDIQINQYNIDAIKQLFGSVAAEFQGMFDKLAKIVKDAQPAIDAFIKSIQDLSDQSEVPPKQPYCIRHQHAMKGGRCPRCERENYRKGHGYR